MVRLASALAVLLMTTTAHADRDPAFEEGLVEVAVQGDQVMPGPQYARPQLVFKDTSTAKTVGAIAAVGGSLSLVAGWVTFVARANVRLEPRLQLGDAPDTWRSLGMWSMSLTGFGAANVVASELLLLPPSKSIPTLAWISGIAGVGVAAVGLAYAVGSTTCAPIAYQPGSTFPVDCMSPTADSTFGPLLMMTAGPLIGWPLTYILRNVFSGPAESLTFNGAGLQYTSRF